MKPHRLSPIGRSRILPLHQAKMNSSGAALVPMVQSTDLRQFHYIPKVRRVHRSWFRSVFPEGQMGS